MEKEKKKKSEGKEVITKKARAAACWKGHVLQPSLQY